MMYIKTLLRHAVEQDLDVTCIYQDGDSDLTQLIETDVNNECTKYIFLNYIISTACRSAMAHQYSIGTLLIDGI